MDERAKDWIDTDASRYGVTRVYAQQCGYVLSDAESARNSMKAVFKVLRASALDAEGGHKAR